MDTIELGKLERQVDYLLRLLELTRSENQMLHKKLSGHIQERSHLMEKNTKAAEQVKAILKKLKEEIA